MPTAFPPRPIPQGPRPGGLPESTGANPVLALIDSALAGLGVVLPFLLAGIFVPLSVLLPLPYPGFALAAVGAVGAITMFALRARSDLELTRRRLDQLRFAVRGSR